MDLNATSTIKALVTSKLTTSTGVTEDFESRRSLAISLEPRIHAFTQQTWDMFRDNSTCAPRAHSTAPDGRDDSPLRNITYALKDVFDVAGLPTTCHSHLMLRNVARTSSRVFELLSAAGAVLVGKAATHEFALGGPSFDLPYPPARNPWDADRIPGGSSSGSAAAVASRITSFAVGTDTSGSTRVPASYCGVYGLKPTFGIVPRSGAYPLSFALDHVGIMTAHATDLEVVLNVLKHHDHTDPSSAPQHTWKSDRCAMASPLTARVGYARSFFARDPSITPSVLTAIDDFADSLRMSGVSVELVELPSFEAFNSVGRVLMAAEGFAIHKDLLMNRGSEYGRYTYERLMSGARVSAAEYIRATQARSTLRQNVEHSIFSRYDVLLTATTLQPAPRFDAFPEHWPPDSRVNANRTIPFNVTGHPALAVPLRKTESVLPLSAQLVGRYFADSDLIQFAAFCEELQLLEAKVPPLTRAWMNTGGEPR